MLSKILPAVSFNPDDESWILYLKVRFNLSMFLQVLLYSLKKSFVVIHIIVVCRQKQLFANFGQCRLVQFCKCAVLCVGSFYRFHFLSLFGKLSAVSSLSRTGFGLHLAVTLIYMGYWVSHIQLSVGCICEPFVRIFQIYVFYAKALLKICDNIFHIFQAYRTANQPSVMPHCRRCSFGTFMAGRGGVGHQGICGA